MQRCFSLFARDLLPPARRAIARPHAFRRTCATTVGAAELQLGQPLHETHPHLLQAGERTLPPRQPILRVPTTLTAATRGRQ